ncbi:unnamed protein product [Cyclocybe aegerita]|uniref:Uncharacterized protein n=1 Tax=Cyclocybe aegerita TaxID=1973307 RepID=A0A8S0W356_CYCAE|nr:unnamed protein product [Cyclocybe aegerita]
MVIAQHLRGWKKLARGEVLAGTNPSWTGGAHEEFTLEGFYKCLIRWIIVDDQSINVIDSRELHNLLTYISYELMDDDIPHRSTLMNLIIQHFFKEYGKVLLEIKDAAGRVSYTADAWSHNDLSSFLAITAHYMYITPEGHLVLRNRLITFHHLEGSHDGKNLADVFFHVLQEVSGLDCIGMITLNNAGNNDTMMKGLETRLRA